MPLDSELADTTSFQPDADPLRLENQLCFPLYAASRLVTRLYQPLLEPLQITYPQYVVLMILWEAAPCPVREIGRRALLNSNTLTPLLKRMEEMGLIHRERSQKDERVVLVALTEAGQAMKEKCQCIPGKLYASVPFPLEKAYALKQNLDELITLLQNAEKE